ncbi:MAG: hypothetical protein IPM54_40445 [Polyangiaceae bacterium]|nr:hypothetical protein [Polyangiaceae bacterium]
MESFRECGWPAFAALAAGILATLVAITALALAVAKPRGSILLGVLALAMSLGAPGVGFAGMIWGRQQTDAALSGPSISPEFKQKIREAGYDEAGQCVPVGASIGVLPFVVAGIAIAVGFAQKGKTKA